MPMGPTQLAIVSALASYPPFVPLPASGSICESPLALAQVAPPQHSHSHSQQPQPQHQLQDLPPKFQTHRAVFRIQQTLKQGLQHASTSCCVGLGALPSIGDVGAPCTLERREIDGRQAQGPDESRHQRGRCVCGSGSVEVADADRIRDDELLTDKKRVTHSFPP
ncbi:hypothetical protein V8E53_015901 [Lactarius tabidus]